MLKNGLGGLMKQAQEMQENMRKTQESLALVDVEGQAGAGMVKLVMSCAHVVKRVHIDWSMQTADPEDREMLEDLIAAAFNDAIKKAALVTQEKMAGFASGMNLPAGLQLPF